MKKITAVLLVAAMILSFAACGASQNTQGSSENPTQSPAENNEQQALYVDLAKIKSIEEADDCPVKATAENGQDNTVKLVITNNSEKPVSEVVVDIVGLNADGKAVKIDSSISMSKSLVAAYQEDEEIAAGASKEVILKKNSDSQAETYALIIESYKSSDEVFENENVFEWGVATAYSDSSRKGTDEGTAESEELTINDIDALKAAAEKNFDVNIENARILYNFDSRIGAMDKDRLCVDFKNNTSDEISEIKMFIAVYRKDFSRSQMGSIQNTILMFNEKIFNGLYVLSTDSLNIAAGETAKNITIEANCAKFSDYSVIIASYKTASGKEVKNPAADEWISAATNAYVTQADSITVSK